MDQQPDSLEATVEVLSDIGPSAGGKTVEHSYTREELLSFAHLELCKIRPENLDPVVWRDTSTVDGAEKGIAMMSIASRGLVRRDREGDAFTKSSTVDVPEWRKDSWRSGGTVPLSQGPRRKPYDEEPGNTISTSYPPRPLGNWGDNSHGRNSYERPWLQGQGSGRWDHRTGLPDREREQGRSFQKWDGEDIGPLLPPDGLPGDAMRPFGTAAPVVRPGWLPAERDGLLGSGGGLQRTFTGNFTHGPVRTGLDRQMSMGPPPLERQISLGGPPERLMNMGLSDRQMSIGAPERQMSIGPGIAERQMGMGPPSERHISIGLPPDRQTSLGVPPERHMSMGPPERQLSMGRQISMGREHPRHSEPFHSSRPLKVSVQGSAFARREDTDFNNDETFGSEEKSTDDRSEQERKRRESFELMRKNHQRELQKQQRILSQKQEERLSNPESNAHRKHDESGLWDSTGSVEVIPASPPTSPEKVSTRSEEAVPAVVSTPAVVPSTSRPTIPPGFAKVLQQPQNTSKSEIEGKGVETRDNVRQTGLQNESAGLKEKDVGSIGSVSEKALSAPDHSLNRSDVGDSLASMSLLESVAVVGLPPTEIQEKESSVSLISRTAAKAGETIEGWSLGSEVVAFEKQGGVSFNPTKDIFAADDAYPENQESILDRWFSTSAKEAVDGVAPLSDPLAEESQRTANEDGKSGLHSRMSKFAQWFHPEESQSTEGASAAPAVLPSFTKRGFSESSSLSNVQVPTVPDLSRKGPAESNVPRHHARFLPMPSGPSLEDIEKGLTAGATSSQDCQSVTKEIILGSTISLKKLDVVSKPADPMSGVFGEHSPVGKFRFQQLIPPPPPPQSSKQEGAARSSPVFLTCEDIEQSMLAEAGTTLQKGLPHSSRPIQTAGAIPSKRDGEIMENLASHHLLSLLQKGFGGGLLATDNSWSSHSIDSPGVPAKASTDDHFNIKDGAERPSVEAQGLAEACKDPSTDNSTLEILFGKAFMTELRSVEAPLSATGLSNKEGVYPVSRQNRGCVVSNSAANASVAKEWPAPIGPLSGIGRTEENKLDARFFEQVTGLPLLQPRGNQLLGPDKEENCPVISSGHELWGVGGNSHLSHGRQHINAAVGNDDSFVSTSLAGGNYAESVVKGKGPVSGLQSSDVDMHSSFELNRNGRGSSSGVTTSGHMRVPDDSNLAQVLSSDVPVVGPVTSFDTSKSSVAFTRDGSVKAVAGEGITLEFGSSDLSPDVGREDNAVAGSLGSDFLLTSRKLDREVILDDDVFGGDKVDRGDDGQLGNERKGADTVSETSGFLGRAKDANMRTVTIPAAGLSEQVGAGLVRANSGSLRFKGNHGPIQPLPGFPPFQPVGHPLQHQHPVGAGFRLEATAPSSLPTRQHSLPLLHHHLQQNSIPASIAMFPPQNFRPQPGLSQPQQLLGRTFSTGNPLESPHLQLGHPSSGNLSRPLPAGALQFPAQGHGLLPQHAAYPPMRPMGPAPDHYTLPSAQMPQRGLVMPSLGETHVFVPEHQPLHDPHGLFKLGSQPRQPPLFALGGHPLTPSGQGPMCHQPSPQILHGQQTHLLPGPGPAPWVVPYSSELIRTASKGHELAGLTNGVGVVANSLDRWFPTNPSRGVSGIPNPGLIPLAAHGLDAENKMRFG